MFDHLAHAEEDQWLIWNTAQGLLTAVTIGEVEEGADGRSAWLDEPFDMVGPFDLDELEAEGRIHFAAAIIMSRQRWQQDQAELRRESVRMQREEQERVERKYGDYDGGRDQAQAKRKAFNEKKHRETLKLPKEGKLEIKQIKAAFRKLAQKAHPDVGGSHELFVQITEARDALLEFAS